jgi:MFS family permease
VTPGINEVAEPTWRESVRERLIQRASASRRRATFLVLLAGTFTVSVTITLLVVSLPSLARELDTSVGVVSWAITGPMLAFGVVGPAFGKLGDLIGHKRIFVGGLFVAGVMSLVAGLAPNAAILIASRTLAAAAGSATGPAAMAFVNRMFAPHERVRPLGWWSFTTSGAPVIGVVAGVPLVEWLGWRVIFLVQAPLSVLGALLAWWLLGDTQRREGVRFDVRGAVTLGVASVLLLLVINRGDTWGWGSGLTIAVAIAGVAALVEFVRVERRVAEPMVPPALWRNSNVSAAVLSKSLANFAYMGGFMVAPQMLQDGRGMTVAEVGWVIIARPLAFALFAAGASRITMRTGERLAGMAGSMTVFTSMVLLSVVEVRTPVWIIVVALALSGVGLGVSAPALSAVVANSVPEEQLGVVSALTQLMTQMGALLGAAVMISVHESFLSRGVLESFSVSFVVAAGACVFAGLFAGDVRSTPRRVSS